MTSSEDLEGIGGVVWSDRVKWDRRLSPEGCVICALGGPVNVIADLPSCWVTADPKAPVRHHVSVVAREHVIEPYEMSPDAQSAFWRDAMLVSKAVASIAEPIKTNYEIHGNTIPHLHLHVYPRSPDDPFVGRPIDASQLEFERTEDDLEALRAAIIAATPSSS